MKTINDERVELIKSCVEEYFDLFGFSPSIREISNVTKISKSTVQRYIECMESYGIITRENGFIETEYMSKTDRNMISVAVVGQIHCGDLAEEEEYIDEYIKLPRSWLGKGKFFILTANGNSMIEAGIDDGDLVVIRQQNHASVGDIVVALAEGKNTLKRYLRDDKNHKIILHPENSALEDIIVDECQIQGVAVKVIKSL